jgi:hypothetical protein
MFIQRKYQQEIRNLIGLDLYDVDEMGDDDDVRGGLVQKNKPSSWCKVGTKDGGHYYYNKVTGDSQWNKPLFTLGPPHVSDFVACHGPENDPLTWMRIETPTNDPYYYNTVTRTSTWIPPRFSANWEAEKNARENANKKRRQSSWIASTNSGSRSGFHTVFTNSPHRCAPWDFSAAADPALIHGGFTVDSKDERLEAFDAAVCDIVEKEQTEERLLGGTVAEDAMITVTWGAVKEAAELQLFQIRKARLARNGYSVKKLEPTDFDTNSHFRRVDSYKGMELHELHDLLTKRGLIAPNTTAPTKGVHRGSLDPALHEVTGFNNNTDGVEMTQYEGSGLPL